MKIDKRTINTMQRMYKSADEMFTIYNKEQQKLEHLTSNDTIYQNEKIQEQIQVCTDTQIAWDKERRKADDYVRRYMRRHDVDNNIEKMEELIAVMPECFFRYLLFRQMKELKDQKIK